MADAPARALVIYGDAVLPAVAPHHTHIHSLAASGCCGFLALRQLPPSVNGAQRVVTELAQLLDLHDMYTIEAREEDCLFHSNQTMKESALNMGTPSMADRFMGVRAAMLTNSRPAGALGKRAGFTVSALNEILPSKTSGCSKASEILPDPAFLASKLLNLLNLGELKKEQPTEKENLNDESSDYDLLLLHILAEENCNSGVQVRNPQTDSDQLITSGEHLCLPSKYEVADWLDSLLVNIKHLAVPGSKASKHCYMVLILGYGTVVLGYNPSEHYPLLEDGNELTPDLLHLRPRQSYSMKGGEPVVDIRNSHPLLAVHHLESVTRCDLCRSFDFKEFKEKSGNLAILADRFLHEVAFKMWKAPKYGA